MTLPGLFQKGSKMTKRKAVDLKATAAFVLDGEIVRPGAVISVADALARNLLHRGRAVLATADDEAPADKPKGSRKAKPEAPAGKAPAEE
jgi:hypothetical protein